MLVKIAIFITSVFFSISGAFAQEISDDFSEMDLLMAEKKEEGKLDSSKNLTESDENIDKDSSFAENLSKKNNKVESESWLKSLVLGKIEKSIRETTEEKKQEEERVEKVRKNLRSNAANFDISKIRLRMKPKQINKILTEQGYQMITQTYDIPNFIKWRSEEMCRLNGIIGFERLNACAVGVAKENGYQYIDKEVYNRYSTKESIEVYYTSSFTENVAHHIFYKSNVPLSESKASNRVYINNIKIYDFWQRVNLRYGPPDNKTESKWGLGGKKPYLKATTGTLELSDPLLRSLDTKRMFNEDTRMSNTQYYTF